MFASQVRAAPKWYEPPAVMIKTDVKNVYASPQEPLSERLEVRMSQNMKLNIDALARIWRIHAEARGDAASEVTPSYVVKRVLAVGIDMAFDQMGLPGRPKNQEEWEVVEKSVEKLAAALAEEASENIESFVEQNAQIAAAAKNKHK